MNIEIILIISIFLLLALALVPLLIRRTINATIEGFSWTRKVFFEHCLWVEETSYSGYPEGSINQHQQIIFHDKIYRKLCEGHKFVHSVLSKSNAGNSSRLCTIYTHEIQSSQPPYTI